MQITQKNWKNEIPKKDSMILNRSFRDLSLEWDDSNRTNVFKKVDRGKWSKEKKKFEKLAKE